MVIEIDTNDRPTKFTMLRPFDGHVHLREGAILEQVIGFTAKRFLSAIVMPNLARPIRTVAEARRYCMDILSVVPEGSRFKPFMTIFLTNHTSPEEVIKASNSRSVVAFKLYPCGVTTNSETGVTDIEEIFPVLEAMEKLGIPLLVHGEVDELDGNKVDIFDREKVFIDVILDQLVRRFSALKISLEHISTKEGVTFVESAPPRVVGTITPHHLLLNRNALFDGGIRPHHFCLPVLKREEDRTALVKAVTSGNPKFFLGTDSAPHLRSLKEIDGGRGGIFSAPAGVELYVDIFEQAGKLGNLEMFAAQNGPAFYGLPARYTETITLIREPWVVPEEYRTNQSLSFDDEASLAPFRAGTTLQWRICS